MSTTTAARRANDAERQARARAKRQANGLEQVNVWLPAGAAADLMIAAELMRANPALRIARLVDTKTGKLVGLKGAATARA